MAEVFNRETKQRRTSVHTPDYDRPEGEHWDDGTWIINPTFIPDCESKYITVEGDIIREMTTEGKAVVDYVAPLPEPTAEELAAKVAETRRQDIQHDIRLIYPSETDEIEIFRTVLAQEFPNNTMIQEHNAKIEAILAKHPKV